MGHLIENPIGRCTELHHVNDNRSCTWLSIADVNQATDYVVEGEMVRELGLALGEHFGKLVREGKTDRAEITLELAQRIGVTDLSTLMLP